MKRKSLKLVPMMLLLAAFAAPTSFAAEAPSLRTPSAWKLFATDTSEGAEAAFRYYDNSRVKKVSDTKIRVWEIIAYPTTEDIYARHEVLWEMDSAGKSARKLKTIAVLRDGNTIVTTPPAGSYVLLASDSRLKEIWKQVAAG